MKSHFFTKYKQQRAIKTKKKGKKINKKSNKTTTKKATKYTHQYAINMYKTNGKY